MRAREKKTPLCPLLGSPTQAFCPEKARGKRGRSGVGRILATGIEPARFFSASRGQIPLPEENLRCAD